MRTKQQLTINQRTYNYHDLTSLESQAGVKISRLPYSIRILLENLIRNRDEEIITTADILTVARWRPQEGGEIAWYPSRVIMQDFTGLPAALDLAVLREKLVEAGGNGSDINPAVPVDIIIDHSLQIQSAGSVAALQENAEREFQMNRERFSFLKWAGSAFRNLRLFPPGTGIIHQVNLEYIARVAVAEMGTGNNSEMGTGNNKNNKGKNKGTGQKTGQKTESIPWIFPETLIGTDSHTTMINGIGIPGWGVGGIEAEAVLLGQPNYIKIPTVIGVQLSGCLPAGVTATDLALTLTQFLRKEKVVDCFVEFHGDGIGMLSIPDRAVVANMAPEYGATMGYFPVDQKVVDYLELTGRIESAGLVEQLFKRQQLFYNPDHQPVYSRNLSFNLATVRPSVSGPSRPQDRINVSDLKTSIGTAPFTETVPGLRDGSIVIASITSCTNTSNPSLIIAAGLLAKRACELGLTVPSFTKTSMIPGSRAVEKYLRAAGLLPYLEQLGFHIAGFGCGVCVGNSGSLLPGVEEQIKERRLNAAAVLSGNRNFEARIHRNVRSNFLASPPLVIAFALVGTVAIDLTVEPLGIDSGGREIYLKDLWPDNETITRVTAQAVGPGMVREAYESVSAGDENWQALDVPSGDLYQWQETSTYVRKVPFFDAPTATGSAGAVTNTATMNNRDIIDGRALLVLGDSITTDHISPVSAVPLDSPAGRYLQQKGVSPQDFNSYGARRGDHEVMVRGTFSNVRLKNRLAAPLEGGWTRLGNETVSIFDAAEAFKREGVQAVVFAGKEYGTGSARDWAAKGTMMLGIRAVIAQSFERIHRSNLVGMGVLPLQFRAGESFESLGLKGDESITITGLSQLSPGKQIKVHCLNAEEPHKSFFVNARLDTPKEVDYYNHGGILQYVLQSSLQRSPASGLET